MAERTIKEIMDMVRRAVIHLNGAPAFHAGINLYCDDIALASAFIDYCKHLSDIGAVVPMYVTEAWESIPDEWIDGDITITYGPSDGYKPCPRFGDQHGLRNICRKCFIEDLDRHYRCKQAHELIKTNTTDTRLTAYGHLRRSRVGTIDEMLIAGPVYESDIVHALMEKYSDMSYGRCIALIRAHINNIAKKRGVVIVITTYDNGVRHYTATVDRWCGDLNAVTPVKNLYINRKTKIVKTRDEVRAEALNDAKKVLRTKDTAEYNLKKSLRAVAKNRALTKTAKISAD